MAAVRPPGTEPGRRAGRRHRGRRSRHRAIGAVTGPVLTRAGPRVAFCTPGGRLTLSKPTPRIEPETPHRGSHKTPAAEIRTGSPAAGLFWPSTRRSRSSQGSARLEGQPPKRPASARRLLGGAACFPGNVLGLSLGLFGSAAPGRGGTTAHLPRLTLGSARCRLGCAFYPL